MQTLTLGELIVEVKCAIDNGAKTIGTLQHSYDSSKRLYSIPDKFFSWRGNYEDLAFSYKNSTTPLAIEEFLAMLEKQIDSVHEGYKGGDYLMDANTLVYISSYGAGYASNIERVIVHRGVAEIQTIETQAIETQTAFED